MRSAFAFGASSDRKNSVQSFVIDTRRLAKLNACVHMFVRVHTNSHVKSSSATNV